MQRKNRSPSPKSLLQQNKNTNVNMSKDHRCGPKILDNFFKCLKDSGYTPVIRVTLNILIF